MTKRVDQPGIALAGTGLGLRIPHIKGVLSGRPNVPWFEVLADNHTATGGLTPVLLEAVREEYPITLHCVGMSPGGADPIDFDYLQKIRRMIERYEPVYVSDHLCFTHHAHHQYHDLFPLPYNEAVLRHVSERIQRIQDFLGIRLLVENVSSYLVFNESTMSEAEFLSNLADSAECDLVFDVNNAYVNEINHGFPARAFLETLPLERIREIHLGGYEDKGDCLIDAHNHPVSSAVWELFADVIRKLPEIPVLIEWDNDLPSLEALMAEAAKAESIRVQVNAAVA